MLPFNVENTLFVSKVIRVTLKGTPDGEVDVNVFDVDGHNINDRVRSLRVTSGLGAGQRYATLELDAPGYDGPFCTPAVDTF